MKQTIQLLAISLFCLTLQFSFGQTTNSKEKKKRPYIVWVKPLDKTPTLKGYLSEVGDTLVITPLMRNKSINKIRLDKVNYLEFREKGIKERSMLLGALAGFGIGAIAGYVTSTPSSSSTGFFQPDRRTTALIYGQLGAIPGLLIGRAYGRHKIKVTIQGSKKSIQAQKEELQKYKFRG